MGENKINGNRKTRCYSLGISAGVFKSEEEAIKYANSLKIFVERICKKNKYDCFALFSISQNNPRKDIKQVVNNGKAGRPKTVFTPINKNDAGNVDQHIHIALWANPCAQIVNHIIDKVNKDFGEQYGKNHISINNNVRKPYWKDKLKGMSDFIAYTKYCLKQSLRNRTLYFNSNNLIDFQFIKELLKSLEEEIKEDNEELLNSLSVNQKEDKSYSKLTFKQYLIIIFTLSKVFKMFLNTVVIKRIKEFLSFKRLECNYFSIYTYMYSYYFSKIQRIVYYINCFSLDYSNKDPPL